MKNSSWHQKKSCTENESWISCQGWIFWLSVLPPLQNNISDILGKLELRVLSLIGRKRSKFLRSLRHPFMAFWPPRYFRTFLTDENLPFFSLMTGRCTTTTTQIRTANLSLFILLLVEKVKSPPVVDHFGEKKEGFFLGWGGTSLLSPCHCFCRLTDNFA